MKGRRYYYLVFYLKAYKVLVKSSIFKKEIRGRLPGIEPEPQAPQASILPLYDNRRNQGLQLCDRL